VKHAQSAEQIIALLQAQPASLALHENLIATQVPALDVEDLIWQATQLLKQQKMVECGFLSGLNLNSMIHLGEGVWSITSNQHVLSPAVGVDELSMSSTSIPLVKAQIRGLNYINCQQVAQQALSCDSATAVRALVE